MKRLRKVFSCFLCVLLILTQLISAAALEEAPNGPAEEDMVQVGGEEAYTDEAEEFDEGESKAFDEPVEVGKESGDKSGVTGVDEKLGETEEGDRTGKTDDTEPVNPSNSEGVKEDEGPGDGRPEKDFKPEEPDIGEKPSNGSTTVPGEGELPGDNKGSKNDQDFSESKESSENEKPQVPGEDMQLGGSEGSEDYQSPSKDEEPTGDEELPVSEEPPVPEVPEAEEQPGDGEEAITQALAVINDYLTSEKYVYTDAPKVLEEQLNILGLDIGTDSDYAHLETNDYNRKIDVFYDLYHNKPDEGYDLDTLQNYFNEIVATRLITQASIDKVNNATTVTDLEGISWVTMLVTQFKKVTYRTHSGISIEEKISTLQDLIDRYNALDKDTQAAVLQKVFDDRPYSRFQDTTDVLAAVLPDNIELDKTDHINWYLKKGKNAREYQITSAKELLGLAALVNGTAKDADDEPIAAVDFSGKCITLTSDIDLSEVCHPAVAGTEAVSWQPIGTSSTRFKGIFDGKEHTISGLYINSNETHLGLFGYIEDSIIKNLTVSGNVYYTGTDWSSYVAGIAAYVGGTSKLKDLTSNVILSNTSDYTGGIAAYMTGASKIFRCINHGDINSSGGYVGGILGRGYSSDPLISNCYVTADIKGNYYTGAIVGDYSSNATLRDCFYYNPNKGMTIAGRGKPINCYYLSDTSIKNANGIAKREASFRYGEVTYLLNGRSAHGNYWAQGENHPIFGDADTEPLYRISIAPHVAGSNIQFDFVNLDTSLHPISEGNERKSLYVPKGTKISIKFEGVIPSFMPKGICIPDEKENGVYHIIVSEEDVVITYGTEEELIQPTLSWYSEDEVTYTINFEPELRGLASLVNGDYPELKEDFKGKTVILGRDIELSGEWEPIGKDKEYSFKGMFDGRGNKISGLKIGSGAENGAVDGEYQGLFGYTQGNLKNLTVTGSVYGKDDYVGGIVGYSTGTIENCTFGEAEDGTGFVSGGDYVGGVVGYSTRTIASSSNNGAVAGKECVGGVVGYSSGITTSSSNSGTVLGEERVGGVVGHSQNWSKDRVKDNSNSGSVSGNKDVGGIVGHARGGISGNENSGNAQGLTNTGSNIGGIVGSSNSTNKDYLIQNTNTGEITGEGNNVGGIVGYARGPISGGANSGNITGNSNVGGIVGNLERKTEVLNSYSTGKVTATGEDGQCGSLVGADINGSSIKNSYSYNKVYLPFSGSEKTIIADSYYLVSDEYEGDDKAAKTAEQFKSGEVAWLLDGGENTREVTAWTQNDGDDRPVLGEKPVFRMKIAEGVPVEGCSLKIGEGGLTAPLTYTEINPENPDEKWEWELVYVRSGKKLHLVAEISGDYEAVFNPPLELKKADTGYTLEVNGNYTGHYTFGVIVLPNYTWYSDDPKAEEFTLSSEADLVALGELVNGTAVVDGESIPAVDFAGKVINLKTNISLKTGNWKPIGKKCGIEEKDTPFKGTFDGKNHNISGLNINAVSDDQGLFGYIEDANVRNLSVHVKVNSTGKNTGGIVGFASGKCRFENLSVYGEVGSTGKNTGGIVGFTSGKCHFENLSFGGGISGGDYEQSGEDKNPGNGDSTNPGEGSDDKEIPGDEPSNEDSGGNDEDKPREEASSEEPDNKDSEEIGKGEKIGKGDSGDPSAENIGEESSDEKPGKGDSKKFAEESIEEVPSEEPSEVNIEEEIPDNPENGDKDQNGNDRPAKVSTVTGTKATGGILGAGMFDKNNAEKSIIFTNCVNHGTISGTDTETGGIIGHVYHASNNMIAKIALKDCKNLGTVEGGGNYTAGLVARIGSSSNQYFVSEIANSSNEGTISGKGRYTAGIIGYIVGTTEKYGNERSSISGCVNKGTITGNDSYVGGIAGYVLNHIDISNCGNTGKIKNTDDYTGGICGDFTGEKLEKCYSLGDIEGIDKIGGIVGNFRGQEPLSTCFNSGNIKGVDIIGGIVGRVVVYGKDVVISCYNTGSISGTGSSAKAGGIIGENHFSRSGGSFGIPIITKAESGASNCYNHGKVVSSGKAGAIAAAYYNMNDNCYYSKDSVSNPVDYKNATAIDKEGLSSGKVAWIMNGGAGKRIDGWSQQGKFPVIAESGMGPTYKVSIKSSTHGKIAGSSYEKDLYINAGDHVKLPIMPEDGYILKLLTVDGYNTRTNYLSISNESEIEFDMPSEDVVITSAFGLMGDKDEYIVTFYVDDKIYAEQKVESGRTATEPEEPVKEGHDFDGWYTAEIGGQKWNFATAITEDVTLYAHWRVEGIVEVTFDANGGHFSDGSETTVISIKSGEKITFPEDPERSGEKVTSHGSIEGSDESVGYEAYIFDGWYADRLGEDKISDDHIVTEDMVCYAHWKVIDKFTLGTEEDPFVITSPEVLRELASRVNDGNSYEDCYFQLARGVDWVLTDWTPIGETSEFRGNFDGNGVTIKLEGSAGLFGILTKVKIKNFTLEADIDGDKKTGAIASTVLGQKAREFSEFKDITVRGKVRGTEDVGGFVGLINANYWSSYYENSVSFENCHNRATVSGTGNRVGGFVGTHYSHSIYRNCSNSGKVTGASGVGGLDGYAMYVTIEDTHNTAEIVGSGDNVGGLIGAMGVGIWSGEPMNAIFTNSYNTGNIKGDDKIGGLFGGAGLVGYGNAFGDSTGTLIQFTQCYNTGSITGANRVAGITGYMNPFEDAVLEDCYNSGKISGNNYTAGIFGDTGQGSTTVKNCYNEGKITGNDYVAGIFGSSSRGGTTVEYCYNFSDVKGSKYTAGIFGYSNSADTTVKDCYNRGDIRGSEYVAGIYGSIEEGSGSNETTATYCYSSGKITGTGGAIAGGNFEKNSNCYYIEGNVTASVDAEYSIAKTSADFALGEVAYLLDGGEEEHRSIWTQDRGARLPELGTPSYYKIELESNEGGAIDIDGYAKMFAPSGETVKINIVTQDYPNSEDDDVQYKYVLDSLTVSFSNGNDMDITDTRGFTMSSCDAQITAVFKLQKLAPIEPPAIPEPEIPKEPGKGIGGGDGAGTGKGKGKKTGDGYGDGDGGSVGYGKGIGDPKGDGTSDIKPIKPTETDTTITTLPSAPKETLEEREVIPSIIDVDVKQGDDDNPKQEQDEPSKAETEGFSASGSPGPDMDAKEPKELEEEEEEKEEIRVFEIVKKVMHENPILTIIIIISVLGLLSMGGLNAYRSIKRRR